MWPPRSPTRASMSGGASTWRSRMQSLMSGAKRAIWLMASSAAAARWSSHVPRAGVYGAYWAKMLTTWWPSGATLPSYAVWKYSSIQRGAGSPARLRAYAAWVSSMLLAMVTIALWAMPLLEAVNVGRRDSAQLIL